MTSIAKRSMFSLRLPVSVTIGLALALVIVLLSLLSSYIAPFDPMRMASGPRLSAPSAAHLFGTDEFGRDLFSRVLLGGRLSLGIGLSAVVSGLVIGGLIGLIAAFGGRVVEALLLRLIDVLYSFPDTLIALALVAFLGPGIENATLAIAISLVPFTRGWPTALRLPSGQNPISRPPDLQAPGPPGWSASMSCRILCKA